MDTLLPPIAAQSLHTPPPAPPLWETLRGGVSRSTIRSVADELLRGPSDLTALVEATLHEAGVLPAAWLLLAALVAGRPASGALSLRVLSQLPEDHDELAVVLAWGCADRRALLLDLVESEGLMWSQSAQYLWLAVEDLGGEAPPLRLRSRLRRWSREMDPPIRLLSLALVAIEDPAVRRVGAKHLPEAKSEKAEREGARMRRLLKAPSIEVAPERAEQRVSGFTVRRQPRAGRNDPCPCQSGQKYKRCCEARDQVRAADPAPVPGLTLKEYRARIAEFVPVAKFDKMTPDELLPIPLEHLPPAHLRAASRRFCTFDRFEQAERALELLLTMPGQEEAAADLRVELIYSAITSRCEPLLRRHVALVADKNARELGQFALWLLSDPSPALSKLEELALSGLSDPNEEGINGLICLVERSHPALALLLGRAALHLGRPQEMPKIAAQIESLRDVLDLPPDDRFPTMLMMGANEGLNQLKELIAEQRLAEQCKELLSRLTEQHEALTQARQRIAALSSELSEGAVLREEARRLVEAARAQGHKAKEEEREEEEERRRLLGKIERMKALIAGGGEERAALRQQVAALEAQLVERGQGQGDAEAKAAAPPPAEEREDPRWESDGYDGWRVVLTPVWTKAAHGALHELPPHISREALVTVGQLAAGEPAAWRGAKRLKEVMPPLYEVRVGLRYRAMFRVVDETMELLEIIHRKQLDLRLKHLYA